MTKPDPMRAFMSTLAAHAEDGSRYVPGFNAETALREARAILAETEPAPYDYRINGEWASHVWDHYPHGHGLKETRAALAEALSAFVDS